MSPEYRSGDPIPGTQYRYVREIGAELNVETIDLVSGCFDGNVEEVRLYDRALAPSEIMALASAAARRKA